ncbi:MAG: hypothetical protein EZS28_026974 [Streblomastix strix]|uniref:Uncharacterized protein n=1 Tax=Streblomastix strix TaxID=222440 RepID=A0A5J4V5C4_9EUKA|nr:MAG: hypothetical protein EZS28_026974 [Streblomastix strix]
MIQPTFKIAFSVKKQKYSRTLKCVGSDKNLQTTQLVRFADECTRPPTIVVERENQQLDLHAGQPLPVPENQPAKSDAVLPFMKNILNQTAHSSEKQQHKQQIASARLRIEQQYDEKVADYDPTGKSPTKYDLEDLEDRIQATLSLEINKKGAVKKAGDLDLEFEAEVCKLAVDCQRASAAAIASLAANDEESATEWKLTSHHLARIKAGKAQQRRKQALAPPMFRGLLGPDVSASDVFGNKSKEKLKEQDNIAKLIEHPKGISATNPKPVVQPAQASQSTPTTSSAQQQAQPLIQILPNSKAGSIVFVVEAVAEEAHINVTVLEIYTHTTITIPANQASSRIIRTNFCHNSLHSCKTRRPHRTNNLHNNRNRNESRLHKTLRLTKKNGKLMILRARVRRPNDQLIINQKEVQKEGMIPQYSMDLGRTSISDRLMARIDKWDKIGGTQTIIRGAQPEWISPASPLFFQSQQQSRQFRWTLEQEKEYMNQLEKELNSGEIKEMDNVQVFNPTFLVTHQTGDFERYQIAERQIYQHKQRILKWMDQKNLDRSYKNQTMPRYCTSWMLFIICMSLLTCNYFQDYSSITIAIHILTYHSVGDEARNSLERPQKQLSEQNERNRR